MTPWGKLWLAGGILLALGTLVYVQDVNAACSFDSGLRGTQTSCPDIASYPTYHTISGVVALAGLALVLMAFYLKAKADSTERTDD